MKLPIKIIFPNIIILLILFTTINAFPDIPPDYCISESEYRLYELVNEHRKANELPELLLSVSLCYVAKTHVTDLVNNHPDTSICNLNSWSDKGDWTPCCHSNYLPKPDCILGKPRELTDYRGDGHELAYWEMLDAKPDSVMDFWTSLDETNNFLLNRKKWKKYRWRSVGVGILEGYAVIWVGQEIDRAGEPKTCSQLKEEAKIRQKNNVVREKTGRYYVVVSSFTNLDDALEDAGSLKSRGYKNTKVILSSENFRVSVADFKTLDEAKEYRSSILNEYESAWISLY